MKNKIIMILLGSFFPIVIAASQVNNDSSLQQQGLEQIDQRYKKFFEQCEFFTLSQHCLSKQTYACFFLFAHYDYNQRNKGSISLNKFKSLLNDIEGEMSIKPLSQDKESFLKKITENYQ